MKTCCFFGHAHYPYEGYRDTIKSIVKDLIEHHGVTVFYSGGRGDFDSICARIVGELRGDYPHIGNIKFLSYIPTGSAANNCCPLLSFRKQQAATWKPSTRF